MAEEDDADDVEDVGRAVDEECEDDRHAGDTREEAERAEDPKDSEDDDALEARVERHEGRDDN